MYALPLAYITGIYLSFLVYIQGNPGRGLLKNHKTSRGGFQNMTFFPEFFLQGKLFFYGFNFSKFFSEKF